MHLPVFRSPQLYLQFATNEQHFEFVALPFNLSTAPWIFTIFPALVVALLSRTRDSGDFAMDALGTLWDQ